MAAGNTPAVTITTDGTLDGQVLGVVRQMNWAVLSEIGPRNSFESSARASSLDQLRDASQRSRILVRRYLSERHVLRVAVRIYVFSRRGHSEANRAS